MCKVMEVSRSGFYKWQQAVPSEQERRKAKVQERISYHFHDSQGRYGSPKITHMLWKEGLHISERTVSVYMKELELRSCASRKFKVQTTDSNHDLPLAPNVLNQKFTTAEPGKV
ncbi:IS3 family transposase [Paenibacillus doosanensis]|uniref:IS3 family transposase n=1 Tax=Paenibacillus doosanensis TaxID=1229154 RepID=UPI00217FF45C|nr:IS3 family transposase [Paenibacillus doosanensis]MCS7458985.1 IS3 family transposase [Paenibacillus doosanensis]